jgi:hypothetical protein
MVAKVGETIVYLVTFWPSQLHCEYMVGLGRRESVENGKEFLLRLLTIEIPVRLTGITSLNHIGAWIQSTSHLFVPESSSVTLLDGYHKGCGSLEKQE